MNSFTNLNPTFANAGIHFAVDEAVKFRKQLTKRNEFKAQSGWDDAMNRYMMAELEKMYQTLSRITYNPDVESQEELEEASADTTRTLADDFNPLSIRHDNVLGPTPLERTLEYDWSGADPDIPQPVEANGFINDVARNFLQLLDRYIVELTRLDSRHSYLMITKYESVMMKDGFLNPLYAICVVKGGEVNRSDIPSGVLERDEPGTFNSDGSL